MEDARVLTTLEEVKAVSDPFRYRIIECLYEMNEAATVKQIADKLNEVPAKIHYHVKKLEKLDIVRLEYTKEINGIIAKYYRPTAKRFEIKCSEGLEESTKSLMLGETQRMLSDLYEKSKNIFIDQIEKYSHIDGNRKGQGTISVDTLQLTKEEAEGLVKYIEEIFQKHNEEGGILDDKDKYHCFFSMIKLK